MSWIRRTLGMDPFDLFLQAGVTGLVMAVFESSAAPDEVYPLTILASLIVLGVRRALYLRKEGRRGLTTGEMAAERIADRSVLTVGLPLVGRISGLASDLSFCTSPLLSSWSRRESAMGSRDLREDGNETDQ